MRKKQAKKRPLLPDPRFNDKLVTRFVNMMMLSGKKSVAFKVFYDCHTLRLEVEEWVVQHFKYQVPLDLIERFQLP